MLTIVTYLWKGADARRVFLPSHVATLAACFARTLSTPHRVVCVSSVAGDYGPHVHVVTPPAIVDLLGKLSTPEGARFPSSYRRLWTFSDDAKAALGARLFALDVDFVPVADLAPVVERDEPFVGWRPFMKWGNARRLGGGMYLLDAGVHTHVFDDFVRNPSVAIAAARRAGYRGSDQAWLSYKLANTVPVWGPNVGLYSIRDLREGRDPLPADARGVQFNGPVKPWDSSLDWVKRYWHDGSRSHAA